MGTTRESARATGVEAISSGASHVDRSAGNRNGSRRTRGSLVSRIRFTPEMAVRATGRNYDGWMQPNVIDFKDLLFSYRGTTFELELPGFQVGSRERVALIGRSGCGKSTLLDLACGIKRPRRGQVLFDGSDFAGLGEPERRRTRLESIGLVFQEFRLLEYLTVLDSILLPVRLAGGRVDRETRERARARPITHRSARERDPLLIIKRCRASRPPSRRARRRPSSPCETRCGRRGD